MPYPCSLPLKNKDRVGPVCEHWFTVVFKEVLLTLPTSSERLLILGRLYEDKLLCQHVLKWHPPSASSEPTLCATEPNVAFHSQGFLFAVPSRHTSPITGRHTHRLGQLTQAQHAPDSERWTKSENYKHALPPQDLHEQRNNSNRKQGQQKPETSLHR